MNPDFLIIESHDPIARGGEAGEFALGLAEAGRRVALFLVQNGAVAARRGARWDARAELVRRGVRIRADAFSLRERGVDPGELADGIEASDLEPVLDALGGGARVLWI
jgi:predicted peroxiredoxin